MMEYSACALVFMILALVHASPTVKESKDFYNQAITILEKYPLIDGHNDLSHMIRKNFQNQFGKFNLTDTTIFNLIVTNNITHTDINRIRKGRLTGQFWSVYANCTTQGKDALRLHLEQLDTIKRFIKAYPQTFEFVTTAEGIRKAFSNGKVASLLGLESGHAIESSLSLLRIFYHLGVRYMTLTHNCNTPWADNNLVDSNTTAPRHDGLTVFGKKVIKEMNRLGMLVDLSHVSHKVMLDVLEISETPIIFSHSSVYALRNHTRNVKDDILKKLHTNKGVIMINFANVFVSYESAANISNVVDHFNYIKNLIGTDNIGVGADYDGVTDLPVGLEDVSKYPDLFAALLEDGWTEEELAKIASGNILRVMEENEKYAESSKAKDEWPIDDLIEDEYLVAANCKECRSTF